MYHNKTFTSVENSGDGEVSSETIFKYFQKENILWATYEGRSILLGNIIGTVDQDGKIEMRYQHLSKDGTFKTGKCSSVPEILPNGKIRLHESWEWTSGKAGKGKSIIEEL
ncbi:MAG: n-acetylglutamate synthase [Bacteroidota bacterium]